MYNAGGATTTSIYYVLIRKGSTLYMAFYTCVCRNFKVVEHINELLGLVDRAVHFPVTTDEEVA
jgi:hypothetical protein